MPRRKPLPLNFVFLISGPPQSTPVDLRTRPTCRTSSTECLRADPPVTWAPMEASFPQVLHLITRLVPERTPSPLLRVRQVSTCRGRNGQIPVSLGPKAASPPEGEKRFENPSRGEVCLLCVKIALRVGWGGVGVGTQTQGHACLSPACWRAKIWEDSWERGVRSTRTETEEEPWVNLSIYSWRSGSDGALPFYFTLICCQSYRWL